MIRTTDYRDEAKRPMGPPPPPKLTRRQMAVLYALQTGCVAEAQRPTGPHRPPAVYFLRAPGTPATVIVARRTVERLLAENLVVPVPIPSLGVTWIMERHYHAQRAAAFAVLSSEHPPRTTNHPPPRFRHR